MSAAGDSHGRRWDEVQRIRLPHLSAEAFVSDADRIALGNIQRIPLLPQVLRKFHELALDRMFYARNSAESVRCGPQQYPTIHRMLQEACSILHLAEPEIYVHYDPVMNAYTSGTDRVFIVLHSAMVENMTDEELLFVIGHECGHIKAGHVLYQELGRRLMLLLEILGEVTLGIGKVAGIGLVAAFFEWMRQAEMSCDRAGLLVCQETRSALSALMKIGAGSTRFDGEANLDAFLDQARRHAEADGVEGISKALLFVLYNWQLTHPQVVFRAKALDEWIRSGAYESTLRGNYIQDRIAATQLGRRVRCPGCRADVSILLTHCPTCGQDLTQPPPSSPSPSSASAPPTPTAPPGVPEDLYTPPPPSSSSEAPPQRPSSPRPPLPPQLSETWRRLNPPSPPIDRPSPPPPKSPRCPKCRTLLTPGSTICTVCGARV